MNISNKEYKQIVEKSSKNSNLFKDCSLAFLVGGIICTFGQLVDNLLISYELPKGFSSIILIFLGSVLTGLKLYGPIARYAGAGTIVPITGFANAIVAPAIEFKTEGLVLGVGSKMFAVAGPVLVFGISASVLYGIIYYILSTAGLM